MQGMLRDICKYACVCPHMHFRAHTHTCISKCMQSPEEEVSGLTLGPLSHFLERGSLYKSGARMVASRLQGSSGLILPQC